MYDAIIIGAGVAGSASVKELSRYRVNACMLEREEDMCCGISRANSAIVHVGYDAPKGSLMAKLDMEGSETMPALSKELNFPLSRYGSFVICVDEKQLPDPQALYKRGTTNGVRDLEVVTDQARFREMEPNLADEVVEVLYAPTAGTVCPFNLNIALAEDVYTNGTDFKLNTEVQIIRKIEDGWAIDINQGVYEARYVVNTVGVHADHSRSMVSETKIHITPRWGDYCLLDRSTGDHVSRTIFALPGKYGKGVLVSPTVYGDLIVGPTATDVEDKEATATAREDLGEVISKARMNVKDLPTRQVVTSFAGLRVHKDYHEFIIEELKDTPRFVDCADVESPGLTSCPAISRIVAGILRDKTGLKPSPDLVGARQGILDPGTLTKEERAELIRKDPAYGNIICHYEMVTEDEILDAIYKPLGARSLDGIKRRTRVGMGRYQAGFCTPRSMELLRHELGIPMTKITRTGDRSQLVMGFNKGRI